MASCRDVDEFTYFAFQFPSREEKHTGPGREPLETTCGEMELCGPRGGGGWHCLTHHSMAVKAILFKPSQAWTHSKQISQENLL